MILKCNECFKNTLAMLSWPSQFCGWNCHPNEESESGMLSGLKGTVNLCSRIEFFFYIVLVSSAGGVSVVIL